MNRDLVTDAGQIFPTVPRLMSWSLITHCLAPQIFVGGKALFVALLSFEQVLGQLRTLFLLALTVVLSLEKG